MMDCDFFYELGRLCFEMGDYEKTVSNLIKSYELSEKYREQIISDIYNCFVIPNKEEFDENFRKMKSETDECSLDFIPVSDTVFYPFNVVNMTFGDVLDISNLNNGVKEYDIRSVFISKPTDLKNVLNVLAAKNWSAVYILDDGTDTVFNSLYKLPGFAEYVENNVKIFETEAEFKEYFYNNNDKYLPKLVVSDSDEYYLTFFREVHESRLKKERKIQPLLSICIPTYNRGENALASVQKALESELDIEIEIVVSNNGSTLGVDKYIEVEKIEDSRIKYFKFDTNQGYFENILNCLKLASGKFAVFTSDEDFIEIKNLIPYINFLMKHDDVAAFHYNGECQIREKGENAIKWGATRNYVSGLTFNIDKVYSCDCIRIMEENMNNYFCQVYVHCAILVCLGRENDLCQTDIPIIIKGKESSFNAGQEDGEQILNYIMYENRAKLLDDFSKFIVGLGFSEDMQYDLLIYYIQLIYSMLEVAKQEYGERINYFNVCCSLFSHIKEKIEKNEGAFSLLNVAGMNLILSTICVKFCMEEVNYEKVTEFITKLKPEVKEYDRVSGFDYFSALNSKF